MKFNPPLAATVALLAGIVLLVMAGAGCSGKKKADVTSLAATDMDKLVKEVVVDPERREQMLQLTAEARRTIQIYFQQLTEVQIQVARTGLDYDARREDLDGLMQRLDASREQRRDDLIDLTLRGREILTPAEWTTFAALRIEHVEAREKE